MSGSEPTEKAFLEPLRGGLLAGQCLLLLIAVEPLDLAVAQEAPEATRRIEEGPAPPAKSTRPLRWKVSSKPTTCRTSSASTGTGTIRFGPRVSRHRKGSSEATFMQASPRDRAVSASARRLLWLGADSVAVSRRVLGGPLHGHPPLASWADSYMVATSSGLLSGAWRLAKAPGLSSQIRPYAEAKIVARLRYSTTAPWRR